jgi:hypothetical protein
MIALSYAQKRTKKPIQHHIGVRDNFAGLVGVVVATPDLHDQPPEEEGNKKELLLLN